MQKDEIFRDKPLKQFEFDSQVASVFDDMIARSIPFYHQQIAILSDFATLHLPRHGRLYDLGSSTGNTLFDIHQKTKNQDCTLIGIDSSSSMCANATLKAQAYGYEIEFVQADLLDYPLLPSDVILANYTLQFIRPPIRNKAIEKIFASLKPGGIFLMSEKIICEDKTLDLQMIDYYLAYKKAQGYSSSEIAQKREALENVLIPYTQQENETMLRNAGFQHIEILFRWINFVIFIAKK
ncbi:tRNA (uridine-5-oxyacetic acid methyl ester)(34) synthase TrmP [Helicobacter enhydrae]|uniref:Carboxy-S-adenosyl-L-methionine synthase n=1 Tax=Helicobacter enhydrae TaxID=222136 RepID=A0A1B1U7L8_9HELI|nr:carboxy-S-adenosyl-L-methionine synthase CmoA [Helicobacter enhydrae]ANV98730.1 tRNA (uridine-5-oxyacetic acid methyl ester)(34) synthase TrmP [Helicobacter enhydrae]